MCEEKQSKFLKEIRIKKENPKLLDIQRKLENRTIAISDLSDEELRDMISLYDRQIEGLKDTIKQQEITLTVLRNQVDKENNN